MCNKTCPFKFTLTNVLSEAPHSVLVILPDSGLDQPLALPSCRSGTELVLGQQFPSVVVTTGGAPGIERLEATVPRMAPPQRVVQPNVSSAWVEKPLA